MGFCLLREAGTERSFFAVNVAHVDDVTQKENLKVPACLIAFGFKIADFTPLAVGTVSALQKLMLEASKIGLGKCDASVIATKKSINPTPLLLNNPGRIALVRELKVDEFQAYAAAAHCAGASQMFFTDGTTRIVAGRPGHFALKVNAGGVVPTFEE